MADQIYDPPHGTSRYGLVPVRRSVQGQVSARSAIQLANYEP